MKNQMTKPAKRPPRLFDRVASILEDARASVVRTVNTCMVIAYWLIDREVCAPDDNPTVGLILCTDRNESMVRYTLPKGQKQIFAARYRTALPSEEELVKLLRRDWDMVVREQCAAYGKEIREHAEAT